jgi:hypothetical protein
MRGDTRRRRDTRYGDDADKFGDGQFDGLVGGDAVEVIVELRVHVPQARDKKLLAPSDNNHAPHTTCTRGEEEREREIEREKTEKRRQINKGESVVRCGRPARPGGSAASTSDTICADERNACAQHKESLEDAPAEEALVGEVRVELGHHVQQRGRDHVHALIVPSCVKDTAPIQ